MSPAGREAQPGRTPRDRDPLGSPPVDDADIPAWVAATGVDGLVDIHVHFLPDRMLQKVWAFFDAAEQNYGMSWPIRYREPEQTRIDLLRGFGVRTFAPLVYPHKPGMAAWLTSWALEWAAEVPEAVPTATLYPEDTVTTYLGDALAAGARAVKVHVQVGDFDPRDPRLDRAWGLVADAGVPAVVHCGDGPRQGTYTGMDVFAEVLERHPRLTAVIAHAGLPEYDRTLALLDRFPNVHLDTTMVGTPYTEAFAPVPADWPARLADVADRVVLGTDFPNIPYGYHEQLAAVAGWAGADDRLGVPFLRSVVHDAPARLLGVPG